MRSSPQVSGARIVGMLALLSTVQAQSVQGAAFHNGSGSVGAASYSLVDSYDPTNGFFDKFNFYSGLDPGTDGHVYYVNQSVATANGFVSITSNNTAKIIPDTANKWPRGGSGRPSVRIISDNTYTHGLFIADFKHMPWGCGTWPAYWLLGPNWPYNGEVDIIEGVNNVETDFVTLHTGPNCSIAGSGQLGTNDATNCDSSGGRNGCGSVLSNAAIPNNYGDQFNSIEGGIYATEWTSSYIKTWFFPRGSIPSDITSGSPVPGSSAWGTPAMNAQGSCDIDSSFNNMSIIINIDFCGSWAGQVYSQYASCPQNASASNSLDSCVDFVGNNPTNFTQAYFEINSIKVYQMPEGAMASSSYSTSLFTVTPKTSITVDLALGSSTSVSSSAYTGPVSSNTTTSAAIMPTSNRLSTSGSTGSSISGSATASSAVPAAQTSLTCPSSNGTTLSDTQGNQYILLCGVGTNDDASFNSSYVDSISACVDSCGKNTGCVNAEYIEGSGACYFKATYTTPMTMDGDDTVVLLSAYGAFSISSSVVGTPATTESSVASTGTTPSTGISISRTSSVPAPTTSQSLSGSSASTITSASSSTTSFNSVTYSYTYYTTDSTGSTLTQTGSATLASSASACPTATADACSSNGAPNACSDFNGAIYAVQCGVVYNGTVLNPSSGSRKSKRYFLEPLKAEKRQQVAGSYTECEEDCDANSQCEAFNYVGDECTLIADVTGTSYKPGAVAGTQISPATAATITTTDSAGTAWSTAWSWSTSFSAWSTSTAWSTGETWSTSTFWSSATELSGLNATLSSGSAATGTATAGNGTCSLQCPGAAGQTCTDSNGMTYTYGCSASFAGGDLTNFTGTSFADCLPSCDAMSACVGVEFDNTTSTCYLKSSFSGTQTANGYFIYGTNTHDVAAAISFSTSGTAAVTMSTSGTATVTMSTSGTATVNLSTGGPAALSVSTSGTRALGSSSNTNTAIPTASAGNCRARNGTGYTTIFTTYTVTGCDAQPTCPASGYLIGNGATGSGASVVITTNAMGSSITYTQIPTTESIVASTVLSKSR